MATMDIEAAEAPEAEEEVPTTEAGEEEAPTMEAGEEAGVPTTEPGAGERFAAVGESHWRAAFPRRRWSP